MKWTDSLEGSSKHKIRYGEEHIRTPDPNKSLFAISHPLKLDTKSEKKETTPVATTMRTMDALKMKIADSEENIVVEPDVSLKRNKRKRMAEKFRALTRQAMEKQALKSQAMEEQALKSQAIEMDLIRFVDFNFLKLQPPTTEEDQSVRRDTISDIIDLRTIPDIMAEDGPRATKLVSNLTNVVEVKKRHLEKMERKYMETRETISKLVAENDKRLQSCLKETKDMLFSVRDHFHWICNDHEMMNLKLERQERELERRSIEVKKREIENENKKERLTKEIEENAARDSSRQSKEKLKKLADDHKMEMKKLHEKQLQGGYLNVFLEIKCLVEML